MSSLTLKYEIAATLYETENGGMRSCSEGGIRTENPRIKTIT